MSAIGVRGRVALVNVLELSELPRLLGRLRERTGERSGLNHSEAVQLAAAFVRVREEVMWGGTADFAWYDSKTGAFVEYTSSLTEAQIVKRLEESAKGTETGLPETFAVPIFGEQDYGSAFPSGNGLPDNWGELLGRALDHSLSVIADAKQLHAEPSGVTAELAQAPGVLPLSIIVAGTAASIIGSVAAWRALDPEARIAIEAIGAASEAYRERIRIFESSGKMPPPSETEKSAAEKVKEAAGEGGTNGWLIAGGVAGGMAVGIGVGALVLSRRRPTKRQIGETA